MVLSVFILRRHWNFYIKLKYEVHLNTFCEIRIYIFVWNEPVLVPTMALQQRWSQWCKSQRQNRLEKCSCRTSGLRQWRHWPMMTCQHQLLQRWWYGEVEGRVHLGDGSEQQELLEQRRGIKTVEDSSWPIFLFLLMSETLANECFKYNRLISIFPECG